MEKEVLEKFIDDGLSINDIKNKLNCGNSTVVYWLKKYKLKTQSLKLLDNKFKFSNEKLLEVWSECDSIHQFCLKLDVEIDGGTHKLEKVIKIDKRRDEFSIKNGWTVIRFEAKQVKNDVVECVKRVMTYLNNFNGIVAQPV